MFTNAFFKYTSFFLSFSLFSFLSLCVSFSFTKGIDANVKMELKRLWEMKNVDEGCNQEGQFTASSTSASAAATKAAILVVFVTNIYFMFFFKIK